MSLAPRHAIALALLALAGCSQQPDTAPACPQLALLKDAADLTRFNGHGQDITDLTLQARLTAVPATCRPAGRSMVEAEIEVDAAITRGPANPGRTAEVGFFVAVTNKAGDVLDKQTYGFRATFPPNVERTAVKSDPITLNFPVSPTTAASDYHIYVGFDLTQAEMDYNRTHKDPLR